MENKPTKIIWHHSAVNSKLDQFVGIDNYHRQKGFPESSLGFCVGYHYIIEYSGEVIKCREENEIGAHARGQNASSIGICLCGNFSLFMPSAEQEIAAKELINGIIERRKNLVNKIIPHRQCGATECPGKLLSDNWIKPAPIVSKTDTVITLLQEILKELRKV